MYKQQKKTKSSYSKLNTYKSCGWKYKLTYEDKHFLFSESISSLFGTLVHYIEEQIAKRIKNHEEINYEQLKEEFYTLDIPKTSPWDQTGGIYGITKIIEKFPKEYYQKNNQGISYEDKAKKYLQTGIYRLEKYLNENPQLEVYGTEVYFETEYINNNVISGRIDRVFYNKENGKYLIEDIKTKDKPFNEDELNIPLQFAIYSNALAKMLNTPIKNISCAYDLPFCEVKQPVLNPNFVEEGLQQINEIFEGIDKRDFIPHPSALCAYCPFSETYPDQPEEGKKLCCYYSLWKPGGSHRVWEVAHKWEGIEKNDEILKEFFKENDFNFEF